MSFGTAPRCVEPNNGLPCAGVARARRATGEGLHNLMGKQ